MKTFLASILSLLVALFSSGRAFTLDAAGYEGWEFVGNPCSILVPGYGEVVIETRFGKPLVVDPACCGGGDFSPSALRIDGLEPVRIEFVDPAAGEESMVGLGSRATLWSAIPEPASAGLGLIGVLMLLFGRWR
jgi:hypothetical protein